jgi:hypothetical protein
MVFQLVSEESCNGIEIKIITAIAEEFSSAGILPAIFLRSSAQKTAGETPALRGNDYAESD